MGCMLSQLAAKFAFFPPSPPTYQIKKRDDGKLTVVSSSTPSLPIPNADDNSLDVLLIDTKRGNKIVAFYLRNPCARLTLLYSHGNAADLGQLYDLFAQLKVNLKVNLMGFDYSGYGASSGKPSESNTYADIEAVYECLETEYGVSQEDLILYGQSVGSGPTLHLAAKLPRLRGVVLHSAILSGLRVLCHVKFTFCFDIYKVRSPSWPYNRDVVHYLDQENRLPNGKSVYWCTDNPLVELEWYKTSKLQYSIIYWFILFLLHIELAIVLFMQNVNKIQKVKCPVLVIHGTEDDVVNWLHGNGLWKMAREPYDPLWIKGGGHCNLELYPDYILHLCRFIQEMENITTEIRLKKIRQSLRLQKRSMFSVNRCCRIKLWRPRCPDCSKPSCVKCCSVPSCVKCCSVPSCVKCSWQPKCLECWRPSCSECWRPSCIKCCWRPRCPKWSTPNCCIKCFCWGCCVGTHSGLNGKQDG